MLLLFTFSFLVFRPVFWFWFRFCLNGPAWSNSSPIFHFYTLQCFISCNKIRISVLYSNKYKQAYGGSLLCCLMLQLRKTYSCFFSSMLLKVVYRKVLAWDKFIQFASIDVCMTVDSAFPSLLLSMRHCSPWPISLSLSYVIRTSTIGVWLNRTAK